MFDRITAIIAVLALALQAGHSQDCYTVHPGAHNAPKVPFQYTKSEPVISTRVRFERNAVRYLFPDTYPDGHVCSISWNKLWGACRCGYLNSNHNDSDRFVFRRVHSCLQFDGKFVVGEHAQCAERDFVQIAAYAYDNARKPFENYHTLLKEFGTLLRIETWYTLKLTFAETNTVYEVFDEQNRLLETKQIAHRQCQDYQIGSMQGLYFGGICPAPQAVSVCYDKA